MKLHPTLKAGIDRAIRKGGITLKDLRKQAKKHPGCLADVYLQSIKG